MTLKLWPTVVFLVLGSMISPNSLADTIANTIIIHESEGLSLRPASRLRFERWCMGDNYGYYTVAVFYDVPHEQRLDRLGESYEVFVQEIVVPAIEKACESNAVVTGVYLQMRRDSNDPELSALEITTTPVWDFFQFSTDNTGVFLAAHNLVDARGHAKQEPVHAQSPPPLPEPFFESDGLTIYPVADYWCHPVTTKLFHNVDLDIVYDVTHAERKTVMFYGEETAENYARFFKTFIIPIIAQNCPSYSGLTANAKLRLNTRSDWLEQRGRYWDRLEFTYNKDYRNHFSGQLTGRYLSQQATVAEEQEEKRLRDLAKAEGNPFRSLPGGTYLSAIYAGDFESQNTIAYDYLNKITSDDLGMGVLISMFGSAYSTTKMDMTVLEEISLYYLKRASERDDDCFDRGAIARTFKYSYPAMVYGDGYRTPASSISSGYKINPGFQPLCDRLCEGQGVLYMVAHGSNAEMKILEIADLYSGIDDVIKHYSCRSPEVRQFEANLIKLNEMEYGQEPTVRRNTFRALRE